MRISKTNSSDELNHAVPYIEATLLVPSLCKGVTQSWANPLLISARDMTHDRSGRFPFVSTEVSYVLGLLYFFPSYLKSLSLLITLSTLVRNTAYAQRFETTKQMDKHQRAHTQEEATVIPFSVNFGS